MKYFFKSGVAAVMLCSQLTAAGQSNAFKGFTKEDLVADFRLAMDILKAQHPHPFKFTDSNTYKKQVDSLLALMAQAKDVSASGQFSPIRLLRDVHTSFGYTEDIGRDVFKSLNVFPIPVMIERGKILVNIKGEAIPYGSEVLTINGKTAAAVIQAMAGASYSDGFIETGMDRVYPDFQMRLSLQDGDLKSYNITYRSPGSSKTSTINLPSATPQMAAKTRMQAMLPINQLQRGYWIYRDYIDAQKTGILTVNTFNLQEAQAYKEFSEFFKEANKRAYKNVIIDIRSNGGGNPAISALLYSFLSAKPFRNEYNYRTRTIKVAYPEHAINDYGGKLSEEDVNTNQNFLYQRFDKDSASGFYIGNERLREGLLENFPPDKDAFNGNVYVLTGGGTVSAATYFASLVQKNKRGLIIGKETGSGENSTTAAWFMRYQLPRTKSVLTVPMSELYFFNAKTDNGRGVFPDKEVPLEQFISFMRASQDPEMQFTLGLIKNQ